MSISSRCRFVVGTIDGKCVSYIVDQPIQPAPLTSVDRPSTSNFAATKEATSYAEHPNRPSTTTASTADDGISRVKNAEESNEAAKINASVTLSNQQLDELMDILQRQQVGEQQNKQAWSTEEPSGCTNEQYLRECQSAVHEKPTKDCDNYCDDSRDSGYYGTSAMKPSLLDLKKQQWARERAEMEGFLSPWGRPQSEKKGTNHSDRIHVEISRPNTTKYNHSPKTSSHYIESNNQEHHYESNYPTDSSNSHTPASRISRSPPNHNSRSMRYNGNQEEGRLKWGDRGIAVGHLWEPSDSPSRLPEPQHSSPAWLEKSLGTNGADDVIYPRKVYIEPAEQEERDIKRRKALEHQQAIREQLDERERKRKEERELRVKEEKEEEERIRKENAIMDARYKMEKKKLKKAQDVDDEAQQQHALAKNKQSQGWNKKDVSPPRTKTHQRNHSESKTDYSLENQHANPLTYLANGHVQNKNNIIMPNHEPEILTLHHPEQNYPLRDDYITKSVQFPGGEEEMILLGKEVAVLLAPELERRILMSRSGRDVATQTEITQIFPRRSRPFQNQIVSTEKPIWGANRTTKKYIKQSDKDVYRQRGVKVNSRTKQTTDSTDESDRYPRSSPQLDRRKRAQSLGKTNPHNMRANEEDNYSSYGGRPTRKDSWQANKIPSPMTWTVDREESLKPETLPRRATNSPPVPAILNKKNGSHQQSDRFSPIPMHRVPCPPSPPVPAVLRQLQEQTLPPLVSSDGEMSSYARSVSPAIMQLPTEREEETTKLALPDIKQNLMAIPTESSDLLSQLTSIRKTLHNKQLEWQTLADEA